MGQLIHNNQVTAQLEEMGIHTLHERSGSVQNGNRIFVLKNSSHEIPETLEGICIVRTHGLAPQVVTELEQKGCRVVDLTCPDVKRVQDKAKSLAKEGYKVVVIGKADHPEVIAIKAHADQFAESLVISSAQEAEEFASVFKKFKKIGIVVQTTQLREKFKDIIAVIAEHAKELKIYNTICDATCKRQNTAKELAGEVDLMVVVGSKTSANTTHLAEILKPIKTTIHIESKENLTEYKEVIKKNNKIGVTAGASTPDAVIQEVIKVIGEIN